MSRCSDQNDKNENAYGKNSSNNDRVSDQKCKCQNVLIKKNMGEDTSSNNSSTKDKATFQNFKPQ